MLPLEVRLTFLQKGPRGWVPAGNSETHVLGERKRLPLGVGVHGPTGIGREIVAGLPAADAEVADGLSGGVGERTRVRSLGVLAELSLREKDLVLSHLDASPAFVHGADGTPHHVVESSNSVALRNGDIIAFHPRYAAQVHFDHPDRFALRLALHAQAVSGKGISEIPLHTAEFDLSTAPRVEIGRHAKDFPLFPEKAGKGPDLTEGQKEVLARFEAHYRLSGDGSLSLDGKSISRTHGVFFLRSNAAGSKEVVFEPKTDNAHLMELSRLGARGKEERFALKKDVVVPVKHGDLIKIRTIRKLPGSKEERPGQTFWLRVALPWEEKKITVA